MKLTITDPIEPNPGSTGYVSLELSRDGKIDLSADISPSYLGDLFDVEDPEDIADAFEEAAEGARAVADQMTDE